MTDTKDITEWEGCRDVFVNPFIERRLLPKRGFGLRGEDIAWLSTFIAEGVRKHEAERDKLIGEMSERINRLKALRDENYALENKLADIVSELKGAVQKDESVGMNIYRNAAVALIISRNS